MWKNQLTKHNYQTFYTISWETVLKHIIIYVVNRLCSNSISSKITTININIIDECFAIGERTS